MENHTPATGPGYGFEVPDTRDMLPATDSVVKIEPESYYTIKMISPEFLTTLISNANQDDAVLKAGPGLIFGLYTPGVLYLRSDLASEEFLVESRKKGSIKDEITQHLIDIGFGKENTNLSILKGDLDYKFWFDSAYTQEDIDTVISFAKIFNNLSVTTRFEDESVFRGELKDNYKIIPYYYYNIKIVPMEYLNVYKEDKYQSSKEKIVKDSSGKMIGFLTSGYLYLWDGLNPKERAYYITKSLFWSCGFHGESSTRPDSYFYKKANMSATLSDMDREAIKLLYGGRLNNQMQPDMVKKALDISK
jgi:hypothetical protein